MVRLTGEWCADEPNVVEYIADLGSSRKRTRTMAVSDARYAVWRTPTNPANPADPLLRMSHLGRFHEAFVSKFVPAPHRERLRSVVRIEPGVTFRACTSFRQVYTSYTLVPNDVRTRRYAGRLEDLLCVLTAPARIPPDDDGAERVRCTLALQDTALDWAVDDPTVGATLDRIAQTSGVVHLRLSLRGCAASVRTAGWLVGGLRALARLRSLALDVRGNPAVTTAHWAQLLAGWVPVWLCADDAPAIAPPAAAEGGGVHVAGVDPFDAEAGWRAFVDAIRPPSPRPPAPVEAHGDGARIQFKEPPELWRLRGLKLRTVAPSKRKVSWVDHVVLRDVLARRRHRSLPARAASELTVDASAVRVNGLHLHTAASAGVSGAAGRPGADLLDLLGQPNGPWARVVAVHLQPEQRVSVPSAVSPAEWAILLTHPPIAEGGLHIDMSEYGAAGTAQWWPALEAALRSLPPGPALNPVRLHGFNSPSFCVPIPQRSAAQNGAPASRTPAASSGCGLCTAHGAPSPACASPRAAAGPTSMRPQTPCCVSRWSDSTSTTRGSRTTKTACCTNGCTAPSMRCCARICGPYRWYRTPVGRRPRTTTPDRRPWNCGESS
jgi:hypothetical protein